VTAVEAPSATPSVAPSTLWSRLSDRCNPILVREVQQAVKGRVFPLTVMITLAITVVIAVVVSNQYASRGNGSTAFTAGFATLIPLVVFVVPMQAYQSMRTELKGGIVEQLLLSRLSPSRVLSGKLQAAMVQFALYVSVLSPLLATSYLLRGVDLPTIAISLLFALIVCVTATSFAVSSAAQAVVPALQPIANLGIAFGLGLASFLLIVMVVDGDYARNVGALLRSGFLSRVASAIVLGALLATTLSWLAARSFLLHAFENKSSAFRVFLFVVPLLLYGWMLLFLDRSEWRMTFPGLTLGLGLAGIVFGVFMVTEQQRLSPRVHAHVPANGGVALLCSPLLPGRDRGLLCFAIYFLLLGCVALLFWPSGGPAFSARIIRDMGRAAWLVSTYALVYLSIGRWLRHRLPETVQGSQAGRFLLPLILFLCCVVPLLIDSFVWAGVDEWHLGHVMNPFWTVARFLGDDWPDAVPVLTGVLVLGALLALPTFVRGVHEVTAASKARRERKAPAATVADIEDEVAGVGTGEHGTDAAS